MRSIRLSLIVYFLLLLTAALAAVSWFSYHTTENALRARQQDSVARIRTECEARREHVRADLDRRLINQAHALVRMSKSAVVHCEAQFGLLGMLGYAGMPGGHNSVAMFGLQTTNSLPAGQIFRARSQTLSTTIEDADNLIDGQEYFQLYRSDGHTLQRSETMEDEFFTLDDDFRQLGELPAHKFDEVTLKSGVKVRRVTLGTHVASYDVIYTAWPFINLAVTGKYALTPPNVFGPAGPPKVPSKPTKGFAKGPKLPGPFRAPPVIVATTKVIFIQYASDVGPTEARMIAFQQRRDHQIAQLDIAIGNELTQLRSRMMWIGLFALGALWLGGYVVIRLGLAPLSRMSDAVSKVSPKNFHLQLDSTRLPVELQPIAGRLEEALQHLQRAFAREKQAAADISHELRTPLAALMTTLEVGLKKSRSLDEYREILDDCRASGLHMYQLVERLLTLARLDAGADQYRPGPTDVTDLAVQCADLIRPLAKARGIDLRLHLPDAVSTETDANKLREVLVNLLHNAVEYNKPNGTIELSVERVKGQVRIEVRDTGIGIKPEALAHIFERFYRADPSRHADTPHAGLGLAIVKSYVDLMSGSIKVDSSDAGTTFTIELPFIASIHDIATSVQEAPVLARR